MPPTRSTHNKTPKKSIASSSKKTLDAIPPVDIPESITPGYTYKPLGEKKVLNEDERAKLIHELVGFYPRTLCHDITEAARSEVYSTVNSIEDWARSATGNNPKLETELATGLVALETLLESHIDKAFDKFTAWVLRNAFEFSPELQVVLPWQKGLDFQRGEYVSTDMGGQEGLDSSLDQMRLKVEQSRLLAQKLELAEKKLDKRLAIAKQRKNEVGFLKEIIDSAGLNPLPKPSSQLLPTLISLHTSLQPLEPISPTMPNFTSAAGPGAGIGEHTKAWELGRAAYLNWALNKVIPPSSTSASTSASTGTVLGGSTKGSGEGDILDRIEMDIKDVVGDQPLESEKILGNL
ncbi:uncharacterized protein IL334_007391 [Kwoniella shivajii]|uniref:Kinetochore protein Mis12/MTW1 n=1 Tax=Kwoniella shivajii TaxID=564305 RepID=A0ABZ1D9B6_9TREE|nr:hypothetical protein IL334_007391 [Kwoniella shivajii]